MVPIMDRALFVYYFIYSHLPLKTALCPDSFHHIWCFFAVNFTFSYWRELLASFVMSHFRPAFTSYLRLLLFLPWTVNSDFLINLAGTSISPLLPQYFPKELLAACEILVWKRLMARLNNVQSFIVFGWRHIVCSPFPVFPYASNWSQVGTSSTYSVLLLLNLVSLFLLQPSLHLSHLSRLRWCFSGKVSGPIPAAVASHSLLTFGGFCCRIVQTFIYLQLCNVTGPWPKGAYISENRVSWKLAVHVSSDFMVLTLFEAFLVSYCMVPCTLYMLSGYVFWKTSEQNWNFIMSHLKCNWGVYMNIKN